MNSLIAIAAVVANYACTLSTPAAIHLVEGKATTSEIGELSADALSFRIEIAEGRTITARVIWPKSPLQVEGQAAALSTAPGSYAFLIASAGPCLFTETACMTLLNFVQTSPSTASVILMPTALATNEKTNTCVPFLVHAAASCLRQGAVK